MGAAQAQPAPAAAPAPAPAPAAENAASGGEPLIVQSPLWFNIVRRFEFVVATVILGLSAWFISSVTFDCVALAIATCVITWLFVLYASLTERASSLRGAYNIWVIIAFDVLLTILWLSTMASVAAKRASFVVINDYFRRDLYYVVLTKTGLDVLAAIAGLSGLEFLLFVVTLVFTVMGYLKARQGATAPSTVPPAAPAVETENKTNIPMQDYSAQNQAAPNYPPQNYPPQGYPQQGYPQQGYPQQTYPEQGYPPQEQHMQPPQMYPVQPQDMQAQGGYPPAGHVPGSHEMSTPQQEHVYTH